jgi:hypothetical protein
MDSKIGLDYIVESKEYTTKLGSGQSDLSWFPMTVLYQRKLKVTEKR